MTARVNRRPGPGFMRTRDTRLPRRYLWTPPGQENNQVPHVSVGLEGESACHCAPLAPASTRWPGQPAAAQDMQVQVEHGLASMIPGVDDESVAVVFQALLPGYFATLHQQLPQ